MAPITWRHHAMHSSPSGQTYFTALTQPAAPAPYLVSLMGCGLRTDGSVHVHQLKSLDCGARKAALIEKAPSMIMQEVLDCLVAVFEDD